MRPIRIPLAKIHQRFERYQRPGVTAERGLRLLRPSKVVEHVLEGCEGLTACR